MKNTVELLNRIHDFLGKVVRDCTDEKSVEASDLADDVWDALHQGDKRLIYRKYRILDADSGEEKHGKYFVLRIDANDENERKCVGVALKSYALSHANSGNTDYAHAILDYLK